MRFLILPITLLAVSCGFRSASELAESPDAPTSKKEVCEDQNNIVASGLIGSWVFHSDLAKLMGLPAELVELTGVQVTFKKDDAAAKSFSTFISQSKLCPALAGHLTIIANEKRIDSPFILTVVAGNPAVIYDEHGFGGQPGDEVRENHPMFVMLGKSDAAETDVLFIGGDNNNQPMVPMKRAKTAKK